MATNAKTKADDKADDPIVAAVTEDDLRKDFEKAEVEAKADETADETPEKSEEGEEDGQTADPADKFVKQVPSIAGDTEEEYLKNLETAYQQSTAEALRLKALADDAPAETNENNQDNQENQEVDLSDPLRLYAKQKMDEDINTAFNQFQKEYPQAQPGTPEYNQFTTEVAALSQTIMSSQKRLASPSELYSKAAVILGWEKDAVNSKDKLDSALKDRAATAKTTSATTKPTRSKVSDEMVQANKLMYPNKSEDEIRKELEPYIK